MIRIGTCSWTEKTLLKSGEFYPDNVRTPEERLRYYCEHFDTVEVDSSYYAIPGIRNSTLWSERTPEGFVFHLKAFGALTGHGVTPSSLPRDVLSLIPEKEKQKRFLYIKDPSILGLIAKRFVDALGPLASSGKLGVIVFQFPQWFQYRKSGFDYILSCKKLMEGLPVAVEFRHGSWLANDRAGTVFDFLEKNGITYITADEPQYGSLATVPFIPRVTTDTAYFRFHGRNRENWLRKGIETSLRYSYDYSGSELKVFSGAMQKAGEKANRTFGMMNNCHGGFAVKNAIALKKLVRE